MAGSNWEADKMLDVYIYDYLTKRNLHASAKAFLNEGKVSSDPVAIDAPGGFLFEWWSVFWDIFIARTNEKHSEVAASYIETQQLKARDQQHQQQHQQHQHQQQQQQQQQHQQQHQAQQLQQLQQMQILQRHAAQRQRQDSHLSLNGSANGLGADALLRQPGTANAMATKIYEERLKHPHSRDTLDDASMKVRTIGLRTLGASELYIAGFLPSDSPFAAAEGYGVQSPIALTLGKYCVRIAGRIPLLHSTAGTPTALQQVQSRSQISGGSQDGKSDVTLLNQRSPAPESSMFGVPGVGHNKTNLLSPGGQGGNSLPVKGWPLTGIDTLRGTQNLVPTQKSFMQQAAPGQYHQFQMLSHHQQRELLLQAQSQSQSSGSPLLQDMDPRKFRVLLGGRGYNPKDGHSNPGSDVSGGVGSPMQAASPVPRSSQDQQELLMKMKQIAQLQQQQQQQQQQPANLQQQQQPATPQQQQQDRLAGVGGVSVDGNAFRANDQNSSKGPNPQRKRKQHPASSSGPANSTGTANTTGPSPNSAPSTPSTHTPGDVMSMTLQHSSSISKPGIMMYGSEGNAPLASPSNQLVDIDRFGDDNSLDDNVESFLSHEEADPREPLFGSNKRSPAGHSIDVSTGFSFKEVGCLRASTTKVGCCHFSSDGKLLASAGHDKKVNLWNMDTLKLKSTLEEHSNLITDVRFSPNSARLATSSFDKTVRVWDADNPSYALRTFTGHAMAVMSLDFHPIDEDLLCSCDGDSEIRYWSVSQGVCTKIFKGGVPQMTQMRFQPRAGRLLAAAAENVVSIFDVESETLLHTLHRHTKPVHSVCWDATGDFVASVSEDSVRVWALGSHSEGECVHELNCNGNKFHSCVFHPNYPSLLVIGCYQSLELWNMVENKSMTVPAHEGLIAALAQSPATGMVASASHDKCVKLWT